MTAKFYKESGRVSPVAFLYLILASFTILPFLGIIYAILTHWIPFIYANFFISIGLGFGIGIVVSIIADKGKVRSKSFRYFLAFVSFIVTSYVQWQGWSTLLMTDGAIDISLVINLLDPYGLIEIVKYAYENGTFSIITDDAISGILLLIIWLIEFVLIAGIPIVGVLNEDTTPYNEEENKWFKSNELPKFEFIEDKSFINLLIQSNISALDQFKLAKLGQEVDHMTVILYESDDVSYITIKDHILKLDDDEKATYDDTTLLSCIEVSQELRIRLAEILAGKVNDSQIEIANEIVETENVNGIEDVSNTNGFSEPE